MRRDENNRATQTSPNFNGTWQSVVKRRNVERTKRDDRCSSGEGRSAQRQQEDGQKGNDCEQEDAVKKRRLLLERQRNWWVAVRRRTQRSSFTITQPARAQAKSTNVLRTQQYRVSINNRDSRVSRGRALSSCARDTPPENARESRKKQQRASRAQFSFVIRYVFARACPCSNEFAIYTFIFCELFGRLYCYNSFIVDVPIPSNRWLLVFDKTQDVIFLAYNVFQLIRD